MSRPTWLVLQARTGSSRLPGKALLPVAGLPAVVLAARRAARGGLPLLVATSEASSDDLLACTLAEAGIAVHRGPLDDVLGRFVGALAHAAEGDRVVRLTGDNLLPDDNFLRALLAAFDATGSDYLGTHSPLDGMAHGLSAEVFTVAALRAAAAQATQPSDREHVTPWIRRASGAPIFRWPEAPVAWARLRCTIDSFADYQAVAAAFEGVDDPVAAPWPLLLDRLAACTPCGVAPRLPYRVGTDGRLHSSLTLGCAQLGLDYGIANRQGRPDDAQVDQLLALATDAGITAVDTARAYGDAEQRLGAWIAPRHEDRLRVITKLDPLADLPPDAHPGHVRAAVDASVLASLRALRVRTLDTLLLHRAAHRQAWQGQVWQRLLHWQAQGAIQRLGVSVSTPAEAHDALTDLSVVHLQCPVHVLDQRWRDPAWLQAVAARPDVVVHGRSALLQGLLTLPDARWPVVSGVDASALVQHLDQAAADLGRRDRIDLALAYVRGLSWLHSVVVGVDGPPQLADQLRMAATPALTPAEQARAVAGLPDLPPGLLDPSQWNRPA
jgi:spore coat polysaccharide biosynthesis protein SpsF (cytidylyltransferase family)/aryl-alcohol dehydrogenase-like predicted oxidoreductase